MLIPHDDFKVARIVTSDFMDIGDLDVPGLLKVHGYWDRVRPFDIYYRFFGTQMVEIAGQELTGRRYYADKITGYGFVNAEIFPIMIEKRMPIFSRTQWISVQDLEVTTTTVRLPLSEDGETITGGITANSFRKGHV